MLSSARQRLGGDHRKACVLHARPLTRGDTLDSAAAAGLVSCMPSHQDDWRGCGCRRADHGLVPTVPGPASRPARAGRRGPGGVSRRAGHGKPFGIRYGVFINESRRPAMALSPQVHAIRLALRRETSPVARWHVKGKILLLLFCGSRKT